MKSKTLRYCEIHYCVVQPTSSYVTLTLQTNRRLHTHLNTRQKNVRKITSYCVNRDAQKSTRIRKLYVTSTKFNPVLIIRGAKTTKEKIIKGYLLSYGESVSIRRNSSIRSEMWRFRLHSPDTYLLEEYKYLS